MPVLVKFMDLCRYYFNSWLRKHNSKFSIINQSLFIDFKLIKLLQFINYKWATSHTKTLRTYLKKDSVFTRPLYMCCQIWGSPLLYCNYVIELQQFSRPSVQGEQFPHFNDQHLTLVPKSPPSVFKLSVFRQKLYLMNNELCVEIFLF